MTMVDRHGCGAKNSTPQRVLASILHTEEMETRGSSVACEEQDEFGLRTADGAESSLETSVDQRFKPTDTPHTDAVIPSKLSCIFSVRENGCCSIFFSALDSNSSSLRVE